MGLRDRDDAHHSTGNYGNLDVLQALTWVQQNIETFGANPDNVTIFGQSSGGGSVASLLAMPDKFVYNDSKRLFHAGMMQSGGYT